MLSTGFGTFGIAGSTTTTIIGTPVIDDISSAVAAQALALAQSNASNKAEKSELTSALDTLTTTVNSKASQTLMQQIQNAIWFDIIPVSMKNGTVDSMYETVSGMSLAINNFIVQPVRVATGITQAQENGTEDSLYAFQEQIQNAIGFEEMPASMKDGTVDSLYESVSGMSLAINDNIVQPVRVASCDRYHAGARERHRGTASRRNSLTST
jgi:uncharacterized protein YoxC